MLNFDKYGIIDIISGVLVLSVETGLIPRAITALVGIFLLLRGLSAVVEKLELPDMTFVIYGGADFLAAGILLIGTVPIPIVSGFSSQYAGILMLKGGWTFIQEM